jgi:hypothetical protein
MLMTDYHAKYYAHAPTTNDQASGPQKVRSRQQEGDLGVCDMEVGISLVPFFVALNLA